MSRIRLFDTHADAWSEAETIEKIAERIERRDFTQHVVINVAKVVNMRRDPQLRRSVEACDIVNIDGMGVVWGGRLLGHEIPERVAGIDLFVKLCGMAADRGWPIYLLGAKEPVVEKTAAVLKERFPALQVAGAHHGYFWDDEEAMVEAIAASGARLLFIAITSPKKENFIDRWKDRLGVDFVMGVGGSFDVLAGEVKRAPQWMQRAGLEWLYRVLQEPRRMAGRYLGTNSRFALLLAKEWMAKKRG